MTRFFFPSLKLKVLLAVVIMFYGAAGPWSSAFGARVKDLAHVEGFRPNQLFGYGLVVGLNGTGDRQNTEFTTQTLANLLQEYNIRVNPIDVRVKNVAAVMVTA